MKFPDRILLLYGYHRGTTAHAVERALRTRCEVFAVGPGHPETETSMECGPVAALDEILGRLKGRFQPEVLFVLESGKRFFPHGLADAPLPCWYYAIDPHFNLPWQREYAKLFDQVFVTFRQYLDEFKMLGHSGIHWLAHGFDHRFYRDHRLERTLDVAFVGDMDPERRPQRMKLINALGESGLNTHFTSGIWNEEVARLYSRSRMVFNDNDQQVLNPRNFEGSACGAVVLANSAVDLETFFTPGQDLLLYADPRDLVKQARQLAADPARWQALSARARDTAARNSWERRIETLAELVDAWQPPAQSPFQRSDRIKAHAFTYFHRGLSGQTILLLDQLQREVGADPEIHLIKAMAYLAHEKHPAAAEELFQLLEADPPPALLQQVGEILVSTFTEAHHRRGALLLARVLPNPTLDQKRRLTRLLTQGGVPLPDDLASRLAPMAT
ncbi:MAG: glycosyltransferase family 1 protein [Magnetococcales bacterium]|nr:glycosyltransferase family 1 protein [Magnetococcales bacterium]